MTEAEWLAAIEPEPMLDFLRGKVTDRKMRLFAVSCCRRLDHILTRVARPDDQANARRVVSVAEQFVDGSATRRELEDAGWAAENCLGADCYQPLRNLAGSTDELFEIAFETRNELLGHERERLQNPDDPEHLSREAHAEWEKIGADEHAAQIGLLRDIFGNPFRRVRIKRSWLTSTVVALARGIYDERAFDRLPILADALQDAGCDHADILAHCRGDGPHVRGCWVVDLLLGKS